MDIDPTLPPFVRSMLEQGAVLEPIRLDRAGRWWHRGNPIENKKIAALFGRSVGRTEGGTWVLEVGRFTYPITVEDTPLFVRHVAASEGAVTLTLSDGRQLEWESGRVRADAHGLVYRLPDGFRARFVRSVYIDFVDAWVRQRADGFVLELPERAPESVAVAADGRDAWTAEDDAATSS